MSRRMSIGIKSTLFCCGLVAGFYLPSFPVSAAEAFSSHSVNASEHTLKDNSWLDEINWHGFISQSFVATDENEFLGSSSDGSFKANEAALNASWRANQSLQLSIQGIYKQIGNTKPKGTRLDYAIIDWRAVDTFSHGAGVRIGRLKNPYGFFNETRDVAATNTSILLPESIYIDYLSQLFHTSDSLGIYGHSETDEGTFSATIQYGRPILNEDITSTLVGGNETDGDIANERIGLAKIGYEHGSGLWRTALSYIRFDGEYAPAQGDAFYLQKGDISIQQALLSFEFNWNRWQVITEIQRRNTELNDVFSFSPNIYEKSLGYYLQLGFNVSPEWKVYARRDEVFRDKEDKHGRDYAAGLQQLNAFFGANSLPYRFDNQFHSTFAKDTTVGFRYSPSFEWSFAMEVHFIDGTFWLPNLENPDLANQQRYWNMFLAQVAYRF
jgi:hypothetical protein